MCVRVCVCVCVLVRARVIYVTDEITIQDSWQLAMVYGELAMLPHGACGKAPEANAFCVEKKAYAFLNTVGKKMWSGLNNCVLISLNMRESVRFIGLLCVRHTLKA